jgi:hypothetical protein
VDALLRRLAATAERLIPIGFAFDDPKKTTRIAEVLADLSTRYGSRQAAEMRLRRAQKVVKSDSGSE